MKLMTYRGEWALVTGASAGIGREFALQLASAGLNVALVARRGPLLDALAGELRARDRVDALPLPADLTLNQTPADLKRRLRERGIRVRVLCNNAAFGRWGRFEDTPVETYQSMMQVNMTALVAMCRTFFDDLASFPSSVAINVSSAAALQPVPYMAAYAATKAFVHSFGQALHGEWRRHGILVQTLVPGPTDTEFDRIAGAYESALVGRGSPAQVVRDALAAIERDEAVAFSAKGTFVQRAFAGLAPPRVVIREVEKRFRPPGD